MGVVDLLQELPTPTTPQESRSLIWWIRLSCGSVNTTGEILRVLCEQLALHVLCFVPTFIVCLGIRRLCNNPRLPNEPTRPPVLLIDKAGMSDHPSQAPSTHPTPLEERLKRALRLICDLVSFCACVAGYRRLMGADSFELM